MTTTTAADLKVGDVLIERVETGAFGSSISATVVRYEIVAIVEPDAKVRRIKGAAADGKMVYRTRDLGAWRRYEIAVRKGKRVMEPRERGFLFAAEHVVEIAN